jgi:carbonic anhydrase
VAENVYEAIKSLRNRSEEIRHLEKEGALKIQGAVYDLETGHVSWLEPR